MQNRMRARETREITWVAVALSMLLVAVGMGSTPRAALAHASLTSSSPANGATVQEGLTLITLNFDEEISVDKSTGELIGPNGSAVAGATGAVDRAARSRMTIQTPALAPGKYTVRWGAFNDDDNNLANGTFSFTVAGAGQPTSSGVQPDVSGPTSLPIGGVGNSNLIMVALFGCAAALAGVGLTLRRKSARQSA